MSSANELTANKIGIDLKKEAIKMVIIILILATILAVFVGVTLITFYPASEFPKYSFKEPVHIGLITDP